MPLIQPNNIIAKGQPLQKLILLIPDDEKKKKIETTITW